MMHNNRNGAKIGRKQPNGGGATDMKDEIMTGKKVTMTRVAAAPSNAASA